jgi:class 3 adenylate cyclase
MNPPPASTLVNLRQTLDDLQRQLAEAKAERDEFKAERDESLAREAATAEVLQVINASPGDLAPVFGAMLDKAMRLCRTAFGGLWTWDGEQAHPAVLRGVPPAMADFYSTPIRPSPGGWVLSMVGGAMVHVPDLEEHRAAHPAVTALVDLGGFRSALAIPLRKEGTVLGFICLYGREARPFTDKQIALLGNFAAQAVIAMENARLITETREALEQQTATAEVLQIINSSPGDLAPVFDAILEKAHNLCGAPLGSLMLYDGEQFRAIATRGYPEAYEALVRRPFSSGLLDLLLRGEVVHLPDVAAVSTTNPLVRAAIEIAGVRTTLHVPLRKDGTLLGYISAQRREVRPFTDKQIALLENFAAQAVIAMENARLITETREALEQQTATAEVLQVINSSPGELAPVFDAILEKAHALCGAARGALVTFDGELFRAVATRGLPGPFEELMRRGFPPLANSAIDSLLEGHFVHILDLPALAVESPPAVARVLRQAAELAGTRTLLMVPLCKDGVLLGYIAGYRQEVRPFTDKQIALLQNFAAQAVIAMENARLLGELRQRTDEVAELNRGLEARVAEQVDELGRIGRLKRFLAPQLAELIVSQGDENILESHRREIVVVFCDLRGYTAFTETAEPEEVLDFLREYHGALGPLVAQFEGTLDQFSGDGIMVFFNDPVPIPDPAERAVRMAVAMREAAATLIAAWRERGRELGFGAGIAQGYATLGQIGFSERSGYTAIGTVCNVAARLCADAKDGQILLSQRVNVALRGSVTTEQVGALALKGLTQPVVAYNVPLGAAQPALRVIEGGPQSV